MDKQTFICERLRHLGFARARRVRLYGEELHLISDPISEGTGFSVEGIVKQSGNVKRMRIPLVLVEMLEREATLLNELEVAA